MTLNETSNSDPLAVDERDDILSRGAVREMKVLDGWVPGKTKSRGDGGIYTYQAIHPADRPDIMMWYFYRGYKLNEEEGQTFRDALARPPHTLPRQEIAALEAVLRDKGSPDLFRLSSARTEVLNGKMVLVVEGHYIEVDDEALTVYVDADGKGCTIDELHFRAPASEYKQYMPDVQKALQSVVWR